MGIFSGAFGAGFIGQIGQGIEDRGIRQEKYVDNMLDTAKANAGKYAEANALAEQNVLMMKDMQRDFGITEAEYVALAQTRNVDEIYRIAYETKTALESIPGGNPNAITKDMILKGVELVDNATLPEGMTAEAAIRQIFTGTVSNLNTRPDDKSDRHINNSFGAALKGILNLDPQSSAREQADAMSVAGYKVSDIENYVLSGGRRGKPMPGVSATGMFALPDLQYNPEDAKTTTNAYTSKLAKSIVGVDVEDFANSDVFTSLPEAERDEAVNTFTTAGTGFAKLETSLILRGYEDGMGGSNMREMLLSDVSNRIDTIEEVKTFNALIKRDPKVVADYLLDKRRAGGISDDDIDKLLSGDALGGSEEEGATTETPEAAETADAAISPIVAGWIENTPEDETGVVDTYPEVTELVNADNWLQKTREAYNNQEADPAFKQALYEEVLRKKGLDEALKLFNVQEGTTVGTGDTE
jgi:hypothetical protein